MQTQKTVQFVSLRFIALAFSLLAALLLASAAAYVIRGATPSATSANVPPTIHVQQMTDNQMDRQRQRPNHGNLEDSAYGVGH
jgi:hypothetical protein